MRQTVKVYCGKQQAATTKMSANRSQSISKQDHESKRGHPQDPTPIISPTNIFGDTHTFEFNTGAQTVKHTNKISSKQQFPQNLKSN